MRNAAARAFKRKKLGQPTEPCRSPDQSHWLCASRAARRHGRGLAHAFVGHLNIPDVCQHVAVPVSRAGTAKGPKGSIAYVEKVRVPKTDDAASER